MTNELSAFIENIKSKRIAIAGLDAWNISLAEYLGKQGLQFTVFDISHEDFHEDIKDKIEKLEDYDIGFEMGQDCLKKLTGFDIIFRSPGLNPNITEFIEAQKNGAVLTTETEVFMDLCPAEIMAVTGSSGTNTTSEIIFNILKKAGHSCQLVRSPGPSLISLIEKIKNEDKIVMELKSCQLTTLKKSPNVAVINSVAPNPDINLTWDEYMEAIKNIFRYQHENDLLVLNHDDSVLRDLIYESPSRTVYFSKNSELETGAFLRGDNLCYQENGIIYEILNKKDIILGNIENYLAAIAAARYYTNAEAIYEAANNIMGVKSKIRLIKEVKDVKYYNDTDFSNPSHTMDALNSFDNRLILITSGQGEVSYEDLSQVMAEKVKHLILVGQTASQLETALMRKLGGKYRGIDIRITHCSTLKQAVDCVSLSAKPGDSVLFSPAGISKDGQNSLDELCARYVKYVLELE